MTLDEAIKQLQGMQPSQETLAIREAFNYEKAVRLGIEALERIRDARKTLAEFGYVVPPDKLPSETE